MHITTIGLDIVKNISQVHGVDTNGINTLPFILSKVSPLRWHGVTMKQPLFDAISCIFISLQAIDFTNTKKLFLESLSKDLISASLSKGGATTHF